MIYTNIVRGFEKVIIQASLVLVVMCSSLVAFSNKYENSPPLFITYAQGSPSSVEVGYRFPSGDTDQIIATLKVADDQSINSENLSSYPKEGDTTVVLFLVDISDPAREKIIKKNINQIIEILKNSKEHHSFGIASFAEDLNVISPLGTDRDTAIASVNNLRAVGTETLLYQYIGESIDMLNAFRATRRVLIVFSDGKSEDQKDVYNHDYVIKKAREKNIIVDGLAFPVKVKRNNISHYQTLQRLASETGGVFAKASPSGDLQEFDITKLLAMSDSGGYFNFNIQSLSESGLFGKIQATLEVRNGQSVEKLPINLTLPEKVVEPELEPPNPTKKILIIGAPILVTLALLGYFLIRKREKPVVTYALIESLDGNDHFEINEKTYKIGRNKANNLVLANRSVTSFHAQIHLTRDNEFIITDLQSANGVIVNKKSVTSHVLKNDDIFEIGEVRLRFTV